MRIKYIQQVTYVAERWFGMQVCAVVEPSRSIRQCGSCAMNMVGVAAGRLDAMFEIGFGGVWDMAAGALLFCWSTLC